jgi:hypothetical protein
LNKKLQKGLVAAVAATLSTGIVAPVYAASVETKSFDAQYAEAYNATVNAKTQKELTAARVLVDKLYADLPQDLKNLAATLSAILDPKQQTELVKLDNAIKAASVSGKQADVNVARALIVDMPTVWKNSFSSYMDGIQQPIINKAVEAAKKAQTSGLKADYDAALALYNDLLTVTNNDGVKAWAEVALKAELDKAAKLEVVSVKAISSTEAVVTFSSEVAAVSEDNFDVVDSNVTVIEAELGSNKKEVTLTFNETLEDNENYVIEVQGVKNLIGNTVAADATVELEYVVEDVTKVQLTKTSFIVGDNILDEVKVTDETGREVSSDELADLYGYTIEFSTTNNDFIDADGEITNLVEDKEYVYVEVQVKDGTDVVATTEAVKLTLAPSKLDSLVDFHIGSTLLADEDEYDTKKDDEEIAHSLQLQNENYLLSLLVDNDGTNEILDADNIDEIENLTPAVAYVNDDLEIITVKAGTAKVKITAGDLEVTVSFEVKADSYIKTADLDKTSVVLNSNDDVDVDPDTKTATATLSFLDQYSEDYNITLDDLVVSADGKTATITVEGEGTLTVTSSKPSVVTLDAAGLVAGGEDNEIDIILNEVAKGTATVTVKFVDEDDDTVFTKSISVVSKAYGDFDGYKVELDDTTLDFADDDTDAAGFDDDDVAEFTVYEVDASGNKIRETAGVVTLEIQDTDAYDAVSDYVDVAGSTVGLIDEAGRLAITGSGTLAVNVKVDGVKVSTVSVKYTNTADTATKAVVSASNVIVDVSNMGYTEGEAIDLTDFLFGTYDAAGDDNGDYLLKPIIKIVDQNGEELYYENGAAAGTLSNDDAITPTYYVTNVSSSLDYNETNGTIALEAGEASGTFTLVVADAENSEETSLLSSAVTLKVTLVK